MSDPSLEPASAFSRAAAAGGPSPAALRIELPARTTVVVALSTTRHTREASKRLAEVAHARGLDLSAFGPARWLLIGAAPAEAVLDAIAERCGGLVSALDQSSGRVVVRLCGKPAAEALAKGTAMDLHDAAFPVGGSAPTLLGHINVQLSRRGSELYEIVVMRSYAESLVEGLEDMCREFGYTIAAA